jgi:hypothetical protein
VVSSSSSKNCDSNSVFSVGALCSIIGILLPSHVLKHSHHYNKRFLIYERDLIRGWPILGAMTGISLVGLGLFNMADFHDIHVLLSKLFFSANFVHSIVCYYFLVSDRSLNCCSVSGSTEIVCLLTVVPTSFPKLNAHRLHEFAD